jgi:hypothetical protein
MREHRDGALVVSLVGVLVNQLVQLRARRHRVEQEDHSHQPGRQGRPAEPKEMAHFVLQNVCKLANGVPPASPFFENQRPIIDFESVPFVKSVSTVLVARQISFSSGVGQFRSCIPSMNCLECGTAVEQDARFCPKCYARIEPPGLWQKILSQFESPNQPPRLITRLQQTSAAKPTAGISWQGKTVQVRARYVPRFLWTTASIDVFLDARCVFRTGGKLKVTGSHSASFGDGGSEHLMELTWGCSSNF